MSTYIKKIHLVALQNEEHVSFHTDVEGLITTATPTKLQIQDQNPDYVAKQANEQIALDQVHKSVITAQIDAADAERDEPIRGFFEMVKAQMHNINPTVSDAATRMNVIIDRFSDITRLSSEKQSAATISMLNDLQANTTDINALGLADWINNIQAKNTAYNAIKESRFEEKAQRTHLKMKDCRREVDAAYTLIIDMINAYITLNGSFYIDDFVTRINERIDYYNLILAQRAGRNIKQKAKAPATPTSPEMK
jgi:hypothetical protein